MKIFVASFNRASDGAISKLVNKLKSEDFYTEDYKKADWILAVGDRKETFDFVLERFRENIPIIHLWAGEISQGTHDEVYRHAMTLMSKIQLCTNKRAEYRVQQLCRAVGNIFRTVVVGNVMLDSMDTYLRCDLNHIPETLYDVVLYNPPTILSEKEIREELEDIKHNHILKDRHTVWIEPNGDKYSDIVNEYTNTKNMQRDKFLMLLYHCERFITNSSCAYYEGQFLVAKDKLITVGKRNKDRESKYTNMNIPNASENIMKVIRSLECLKK